MARFVDRIDLVPAGARVLVGMSGGVDSSVAAAILQARGFDVVGVSLHLWEPDGDDLAPSRCCAPEDLDDARRSATEMRVPHFTFDRRAGFEVSVVGPFVEAYVAGTTPSPCVACNRDVKIGTFVALAGQLDAVAFATGHYARAGALIDEAGEARPALRCGVDARKDQSYFLHGIGEAALSRLVTPLGTMHKPEVRALARDLGLPNADKPDSEDLCFVGGDHAEFVAARAGDRVRPGPIVDADGRVLGTHDGVHRFTLGQRKGLGVAIGKPAYVASIDSASSTVRVGDLRDVEGREAIVADVAWVDASASTGSRRVTARVRYRHEGAAATVEPHRAGTRVVFDAPTRAITPGQVCVFYDGDYVLGGGTIVARPRH